MENTNQQVSIPSKKRVYELAKELRTTSKQLMRKLSEIDIGVNNHMSLLTVEEIDQLMNHIDAPEKNSPKNIYHQIAPETKIIPHIADNHNKTNKPKNNKRVYELAKELNTTSNRLIEKLNEIDINVAGYTSILTEEEMTRLFKYIGVIEKRDETSIIAPKTSIPNNTRNFVHFHSQRSRTQPIIDPNVSHRVQMVYNAIESKEKEYGDFKKCEFHLHTPASYDYSLHTKYIPPNAVDINGNVTHDGEYSKQSFDDVFDLFSSYHIYDEQITDHIRENIEKYKSEDFEEEFIKTHAPFKCLKEELAYLLIAHKLFENDIQMVLISDHNTINGYQKLKTAIKKYYELKKDALKHYITVLLGVEITCSEKNHVIGIFDNVDYEKVKRFLEEDLDITVEGTYYPSIFVIEKIFKIGGVAYIAHINSTKLKINKPSKIKLYNIPEMKLIGLTKKEEKQKQAEMLNVFVKSEGKEFCFLYEGDAHAIDEIGKKNTWIKFSKINFQAFKKAIEDHGICIKIEEPLKSDKYIKGVVIVPGEYGFLKCKLKGQVSDEKTEFFTDFSQDLNCIIGGRGSGKSTLINILDLCLSQQTDDEELLNFISKNDEIIIIFCYKNTDYIIRFIPQVELIRDDGTVKYLSDSIAIRYFQQRPFQHLNSNWYTIYRVDCKDEKREFTSINGFKILNEFYRRGYSINDLVGRVKNKTISEYIRSVVLYGLEYDKLKNAIRELNNTDIFKVSDHLTSNLGRIQNYIAEQALKVDDSIAQFNENCGENIKIIAYRRKYNADEICDQLFTILTQKDKKEYIANTFLQWFEAIAYIRANIEKLGYLKFIELLLKEKYKELEKIFQIAAFIDPEVRYNMLHYQKLNDISEENYGQVLKKIRDKFIVNREFLKKSILTWIQKVDEYTLMFNVNNKEGMKHSNELFKDLQTLSMGQKVSALLAFVFNYGKYVNDNTPLIIDQPEDNLDNQYIYRNLIKSLRDIKSERQVIVVTHCSAIVTNADAENVIVLDSDGRNGWIDTSGYPSNRQITEHIINYMEGGKDSFRNKIRKYGIYTENLK